VSKFDVNKIIEESLCEINIGIIGDKVYDKLHPENPNSPENIAFKHAQGFSKASNEGDIEKTRFHAAGLRRFFSKGDSKEADQLRQETVKEATKSNSKALTYGSDEYTKLAKEQSESGSKEAMEKAVKSDAAKAAAKKVAEENEIKAASAASKAAAKQVEAAWNKEASDASGLGRKALTKNTEDTTSVLSHLGKSARKVGDDVKSFGHKVADHLNNLDYGKTGMLAGGAIAAGLGALALRRRMKNAQRG
jgi:membrane protein involved in colicin uptake